MQIKVFLFFFFLLLFKMNSYIIKCMFLNQPQESQD